MLRTLSLRTLLVLCVAFCALIPAVAQTSPLESYFTGKQFVAKIDMPGSEKGIDLKFDKPTPMDWNEYSSRIKSFGPAIRKGDAVRVTKFNVKKDIIEFQLNGGGFGSFGDDTNITVTATPLPKSQLEKDLEKELADTKDPKHRNDIQRDLDKERARRARQDAANQNDALIASQMKAQQVAQRRLGGGSRINLRWHDSIPSDSLNPQAVMLLLADYIDFNANPAGVAAPAAGAVAAGPAPTGNTSGAAVAQLKRGMKVSEVANLLGQGRVISESVSPDGLKTQTLEYATEDSEIQVICVEGVVVRYSISSK